MTVFGIGCTTGLMVVGFGLKDSIMNIASLQYDNIQLYDAMAALNTDETDKLDDPDKTLNEIMENESGIETFAKVSMKMCIRDRIRLRRHRDRLMRRMRRLTRQKIHLINQKHR